jgi:hypothetical protein
VEAQHSIIDSVVGRSQTGGKLEIIVGHDRTS